MSVWREVQETIYQRWRDNWVSGGDELTPYTFANEDGFDTPNGQWVKLQAIRMPGGPDTIGSVGNRKMNRVGLLLIELREPPGGGTGSMSDLAERAAAIFESCRLEPHDIRFNQVEPGEEMEIEKGRWWGVVAEGRFEYEEIK